MRIRSISAGLEAIGGKLSRTKGGGFTIVHPDKSQIGKFASREALQEHVRKVNSAARAAGIGPIYPAPPRGGEAQDGTVAERAQSNLAAQQKVADAQDTELAVLLAKLEELLPGVTEAAKKPEDPPAAAAVKAPKKPRGPKGGAAMEAAAVELVAALEAVVKQPKAPVATGGRKGANSAKATVPVSP